MPNTTDLLFAAIFAVLWPLWNHLVVWPRHLRAVAAGDPRARPRLYRSAVLEQWLLTAVAVALTGIAGREPSTLGIVLPEGWRLWVGLAAPLAYGLLALGQVRSMLVSPQAVASVRAKVLPLRPLIPQTPGEWQSFVPLAVTAGICEELLFRGYLVWVLTPSLGLLGSAGVSLVVFGVAHSYQGPAFAVRAFFAGLVMAALALATGSVIPGMLLHALVDLAGGYAGYLALREAPAQPAATTRAATRGTS
jgi:hypothetical protein